MANERLRIFVVTEKKHGIGGLFEFYILPVGKKFLSEYCYSDIVNFKFEGTIFREELGKMISHIVYNEPYPRFGLDIQATLTPSEFEELCKIFRIYGIVSYVKKKLKVEIDMGGEDPYYNYFTV